MEFNWYEWTAMVLAIVGAINWGLDSFGWNVVDMVFGGFAKYVYWLIGLSGLWLAYYVFSK